ncbi:MAG TPA: class II glutamine amidotransferase [Anaeromyxobacteraceae bacterium]|nr:class II glutamine amidotransferase [Anaeromyxobacteraceae bacterium]
MCRLFAQRADPDFDYWLPLCGAPNALRFQAHRHPHGWGIGWYVGRTPRVRRGLLPAHADRAFVDAARAARSPLVLAHVRDASVGKVAPENTHPFAAGRWLFAHNGTVARFKASAPLRGAIERLIHPRLRRRIRGETDSERCFYLFLTRLGERSRRGPPDLEAVRGALADTVEAVARLADRGPARRSTLNFLVSDGRILAACRHGKALHAAPRARGGHLFAVASEPVGGASWVEIPEGGFAGVDASGRVLLGPLRPGRRDHGHYSRPATSMPRGKRTS